MDSVAKMQQHATKPQYLQFIWGLSTDAYVRQYAYKSEQSFAG